MSPPCMQTAKQMPAIQLFKEMTMQVDLDLLKKIVKECLEHKDSERVIAKEFGFTEEQLNDLYDQLTK